MSLSTVLSESGSYQIALARYAGVPHAHALYGDVVSALGLGERRVIVDCSGWLQLDLRLLSALIRCAKMCRERGAEFELVNVGDHVRADIRELRLDRHVGLGAPQ